MNRISQIVRWYWTRRRLREELLFHMERRIEDNVRAGMSLAAAEAEARHRLGEFERIESLARRALGAMLPKAAIPDTPWLLPAGLAALLVAVVAFSPWSPMVKAGMFHRAPFADADRWVLITAERADGVAAGVPRHVFDELAAGAAALEVVTAYQYLAGPVVCLAPGFHGALGLADRRDEARVLYPLANTIQAMDGEDCPKRTLIAGKLRRGATAAAAAAEAANTRGPGPERIVAKPLRERRAGRLLFGELFWFFFMGRGLWALRRVRERRYFAFCFAMLAAVQTLALALWANVCELVFSLRLAPAAGMSVVALLWLAYMCGGEWIHRQWWRDACLRCRQCQRRLRMPLAKGMLGGVLLRPAADERICAYGHGTLSSAGHGLASQAENKWSAAPGLWESLSRG